MLDDQPSLSREMVELDILHQQAHKELKSYNDKKVFTLEHPISIEADLRKKTVDDIQYLRRNNPKKFISEVANIKQNISRITSNIRNKKYKSEDELQAWNDNLKRAIIRMEVVCAILSQ